MIPDDENPLGYRFFDGGFPDHYEGNLFKTDFRIWLRHISILNTSTLREDEKSVILINLCYEEIKEGAPPGILLKGINWFAGLGESDRISCINLSHKALEDLETLKENEDNEDKKFSFFWDYQALWGSFYGAYKIDLYKIEHLHFWGFMSLFTGLNADSPVGKLINSRTIDYKNDKNNMRKVLNSKLLQIPHDF